MMKLNGFLSAIDTKLSRATITAYLVSGHFYPSSMSNAHFSQEQDMVKVKIQQ